MVRPEVLMSDSLTALWGAAWQGNVGFRRWARQEWPVPSRAFDRDGEEGMIPEPSGGWGGWEEKGLGTSFYLAGEGEEGGATPCVCLAHREAQ